MMVSVTYCVAAAFPSLDHSNPTVAVFGLPPFPIDAFRYQEQGMPIKFECSECSTTLKVKEQFAGRKIRCPECEAVNRVPTDQGESDDDDVVSRTRSSASSLGPNKLDAANLVEVKQTMTTSWRNCHKCRDGKKRFSEISACRGRRGSRLGHCDGD